MHDLWNLLPPVGWQRLVADVAWQSSLIIGGGLLAARLASRRAAARAAILLAAVLLSLVVPLGSAAVRVAGGGLLAPLTRVVEIPAMGPVVKALDFPGHRIAQHPTLAESPRAAEITLFRQSIFWLLAGWFAASSLLIARLLRGLWTIRRWIERAKPCGDPDLLAAMHRAAAATGVEPVPILRSAEVASPALVALGRPRLLVPIDMPQGTDWFAVCCHELAHRARRDSLGRATVELSATLLPWQPLVWLARSGFRAASEEACDDWAVAAGADPIELAALLVELVPQRGGTLALAMADGPKATRRRILRLLDLRGKIHPRLGWASCAVGALVAIGLGIGLAFLQFHARGVGDPAAPPTPQAQTKPKIRPWGAGVPTELDKSTLPTYIIEAPDILLIDAVHAVPKSPYHVQPGDALEVEIAEPAIKGQFVVDVDGQLSLGPKYESLPVAGLTLPAARQRLATLLAKTIAEPRFTLTLSFEPIQRQIAGEHLVGPDGTISLGTYGAVSVAGLTVGEAKASIESELDKSLDHPRVSLDVFANNSKVYYVITEGDGVGDSLVRVPITGNETVLDALAQVNGLNRLASKNIWVARPKSGANQADTILPVNWIEVTRGAATTTNYQVLPGDRIFIADKLGPARALVSSVAHAFRALAEAATQEEESVDEPLSDEASD